MPELPEVETIRRGLEPWLVGSTLEALRVRDRRLRIPVPVRGLEQLRRRRALAVRRVAKYLIVDMEEDRSVLAHLGMSGRLVVLGERDSEPLDAHDHVVTWWRGVRGEFELRFRDPRRFGLIDVASTGSLGDHRFLAQLGPDPLGPEFTAEVLQARARRARRAVKNLLMDARVVTGVGNIYASEVLWRARVNPKTSARRIARARWIRIHDATRAVLQDALRQGGTTLSDYRDPEGRRGSFEVRLQVYGREGADCHRCGGIVRRIVQVGRSTFYCAGCQR